MSQFSQKLLKDFINKEEQRHWQQEGGMQLRKMEDITHVSSPMEIYFISKIRGKEEITCVIQGRSIENE